MARSRARRLDPEDVLADGVRPRPSADELAELIRRTNPTGLELAPAEERRRHALKARLQSLLLRPHAELVQIAMDENDVAAHVPIDELEVDVRAWVRRRIDAGSEAVESGRRGSHVERDGPLETARRARDRGEYDRARELLSAS